MGGRKVWTQETLSVPDLQEYVQDQVLMVFDNESQRQAQIPDPTEWMVTALRDTDDLQRYTGTTWVSLIKPTAWVAIPGSTAFGAGLQVPQYRKHIDDTVELRGLGAAAANNTTLGTLPVGFRPPAQVLFPTMTESGTGSRMDVLTDGRIMRVYGGGNPSFSGIRFSTIA